MTIRLSKSNEYRGGGLDFKDNLLFWSRDTPPIENKHFAFDHRFLVETADSLVINTQHAKLPEFGQNLVLI